MDEENGDDELGEEEGERESGGEEDPFVAAKERGREVGRRRRSASGANAGAREEKKSWVGWEESVGEEG